MWVLRALEEDSGKVVYCLLALRSYSVGRIDADIKVTHKSVSRHHAEISLVASDQQQRLVVKDLSKFGSFLDGQRLKNNETVAVPSGSQLQFGLAFGKFSVTYVPMRMCVSGGSKNRKTIEELVLRAGCELVSEVADATHLVISDFSLTLKAVNALLAQKIIVSPQWLDQLVLRTDITSELPKPESFPPEMSAEALRGASLAPNPLRSSVFQDCLFFFLTEAQFTKAAQIVQLAGGRAEHFSVEKAEELRHVKSKYIVRPSEKEKDNQRVQQLLTEATHYGHLINETSLGLGILHVNVALLLDRPKKVADSSPLPSLPPPPPSSSSSSSSTTTAARQSVPSSPPPPPPTSASSTTPSSLAPPSKKSNNETKVTTLSPPRPTAFKTPPSAKIGNDLTSIDRKRKAEISSPPPPPAASSPPPAESGKSSAKRHRESTPPPLSTPPPSKKQNGDLDDVDEDMNSAQAPLKSRRIVVDSSSSKPLMQSPSFPAKSPAQADTTPMKSTATTPSLTPSLRVTPLSGDSTPIVRSLNSPPTNVKAFSKKRLSDGSFSPVQCEVVSIDAMTVSPVLAEARERLVEERREAKKEQELFVAQVKAKPPPRKQS